MNNFKIDEAKLEDVSALVDLLAELFSIEADFQPDTAKQVKGLQLLMNATDRSVIKVARDTNNSVVGMVTAQLVISTAQGAPSAWMVVSSSFRGGGVGRALLQAAQDWAKAKGATRMQLLVDTENLPAVGYYHHLGWESTQLQARRLFF